MGTERGPLVRGLRELAGDSLRTVVVHEADGTNLCYVRDDIRKRTDADAFQADVQTVRRVGRTEDDFADLRTVGDYRGSIALFDDCLIVRLVSDTGAKLTLSLDTAAATRLDDFLTQCEDIFARYGPE